MLSDTEKELILACAHKYGVTEIYLFGSTLESDQYHDIDLGVRGISPALFFNLYGELLRKHVNPVDVVDLSKKSLFTELIERDGVKLYG
jgi:predicted nucleotidyltransferase